MVPRVVAVVHIAGDFEAGLRMSGDVLADVFEQRAAAHQQQAIAADHLESEGAEHSRQKKIAATAIALPTTITRMGTRRLALT